MGPETFRIVVVLLAGALLSGCTSAPLKRGDKAGIHFTCAFPNGEIAVSTTPSSLGDKARLSPAYMKRNSDAVLTTTVGGFSDSDKGRDIRQFEAEVLNRISGRLEGGREGDAMILQLTAEPQPAPDSRGGMASMARVRKRPKTLTMTSEEFKQKTGSEPAVGKSYTLDPAIPGVVESVSGSQVRIRFTPASQEVTFPIGTGTIIDKDYQYQIVIQAEKGRLIRTGGLVGRIAQVTDETITIDYRHPFGGEPLNCTVRIVDAAPAPAGGNSSAPGTDKK